MLINLEAAVLMTLAYSDQFIFPLTTTEIYQRLLKTPLSKKEVLQNLSLLERKGLVECKASFWRLVNGKANQNTRLKRDKNSQIKWQEATQLLKAIRWVPWIRGIAVTGSLAVNNSLPHSDIDVMIVTQKNRIWLARLLVSLSAYLVGKRRTWRGNEADSWCFNLWLDESSLELAPQKKSLYSAYEVCQAKWVLDKNSIEKQFIRQNFWVEKYLPNYYSQTLDKLHSTNSTLSSWRFLGLEFFIEKLLDLLNILVFAIQYVYMYPHMSRETVTLNQAYFHPRGTKGQIYQRWYDAIIGLWQN